MTWGSVFTQAFTHPSWSVAQLPSLEGKVALVTGASAGLGKVTALELARKGAHVFCAGRSAEKTGNAIEEIKRDTGNTRVELLLVDFMDLVSVEAAADAFLKRGLKLDILVNNAGVMHTPWDFSKQRIESQFATNHFATVVFTLRLLPALKKAPSARIVNLSSLAHAMGNADGIRYANLDDEAGYDKEKRYCETKMANIHFTRELQRRLEAKGIKNIYVNAVHPGVVATELSRHMDKATRESAAMLVFRALAIKADKGALTQIYVAADPDIERLQYRGRYFVPFGALAEPNKAAKDDALALKTWEWTDRILQERFRKNWSSEILSGWPNHGWPSLA